MATTYTSSLSKSIQVFELNAYQNTCIYQIIKNLKKGNYQLKVQWFPCSVCDISKGYSTWNVNFDGNRQKRIVPVDYNIHTVEMEIIMLENKAETKLEFCGDVTSESSNFLYCLTFF